MVCDICGNESARIRRVTRSYGTGENLLVTENVPVIICPNYGGGYLTPETLHEIERIKIHRRNLAVRRPVAVVNFV